MALPRYSGSSPHQMRSKISLPNPHGRFPLQRADDPSDPRGLSTRSQRHHRRPHRLSRPSPPLCSVSTVTNSLALSPLRSSHCLSPISLSPPSPPPSPYLPTPLPRPSPTMAPCAFVPSVPAGALIARSAVAGTCRHARTATPVARGGVQMLMGGGKGNEAGGKNPFGALGNMGNIMDAVKKAQQFTESAKELQDELKEVRRDCIFSSGSTAW